VSAVDSGLGIISLYEMRASEMSSLITNTQKAFGHFDRKDDIGPIEGSNDDTFEKRLDREIKRVEAHVMKRLKPFDNAQGRRFEVKAGSK
jgi:hypothetical protein